MERREWHVKFWFTISMSRNREWARGSDVASMIPSKASVWWRRASIASMYPLGGPRFRDGPRKVQAMTVDEHLVWLWTKKKKKKREKSAPTIATKTSHYAGAFIENVGGLDSRVPSITQLLHGSSGPERSHLHLDLRHWSQAVERFLVTYKVECDASHLCCCASSLCVHGHYKQQDLEGP